MQIVWLNVYSARLLTQKKCEPLLFACVQQASWPVKCGQQPRSLDQRPGSELITFPSSWRGSKTMQMVWLEMYSAQLLTRKKCECDMFRAQPGRPGRKWGRFYCDPSEMQVCYVPRAAREVQQKAGSILIKPFRNASYLCSTQGPRNPSEIRVLYVAPRSSGPKILKCTQRFPDPSEMQNPKTPPSVCTPPHDARSGTN